MIIEAIGIAGGGLFLLGFVQVATNKWNGTSFWYESCNLLGAVLLGVYAVQKQAYTNVALNLIWGTVAFYAVWHSIMRHKVRKKKRAR
jgi:lipid-A-disaccharide synthase-like uncharacterized protein